MLLQYLERIHSVTQPRTAHQQLLVKAHLSSRLQRKVQKAVCAGSGWGIIDKQCDSPDFFNSNSCVYTSSHSDIGSQR
jgi:hypothetical protein